MQQIFMFKTAFLAVFEEPYDWESFFRPDVEVEILGPRAVDLEYITEMIAEAEAAEEAKDNKLWVFDSQQYLEVYAPTKEAALKEASKTETYTGMEFVLVHDWELYQEEAELKGAI